MKPKHGGQPSQLPLPIQENPLHAFIVKCELKTTITIYKIKISAGDAASTLCFNMMNSTMMLILIYIFSNQHYGTVKPGALKKKPPRKYRNKLIEGTDKKDTKNETNRIPCKRGLASYPHS